MTSPEQGPVVDEERIRETYEELGRMHVKLDPNPIEYGPKRFNNNIARVRALLTRVEQIFLQTSEDLHWFKRTVLREGTSYELDKRHLMVKDPSCRMGRSQGEREALADDKLRDQIETIQAFEAKALDLEMLMVVIKAKRTDLKDIQGRMRDQMKLIEHDLGMGARWGRNALPDVISTASNELDDMLQKADEEGGWNLEDSGDGLSDNSPPESNEDEVTPEDTEDPAPLADDDDEEEEASAPEPVIEFEPGLVEPEEDPEFEDTDLESLIPTEGAKGTPPNGESVAQDVDDFLNGFKADASEEKHDDVDGASIDDLIATLADDA
jgi:hypothetical protein